MGNTYSKSILVTAIFLAFMFVITTGLYYLSILMGYHGLAIPILGGSDDGVFYYENALQIKNGGVAILTSIHVVVLGYIFKILNTDYVFVLKMWNFFGVILFVLISYGLIKINTKKEQTLHIFSIFLICMMCYISFIYNASISILRDIWIFDFFMLSALCFALFLKSDHLFKLLYLVLMLISIFLLFNYRDYAAASFLLAAVSFVLFNRKNRKSNPTIMIVSILAVIGVYYTLFRNMEIPFVGLSMHDALTYRQNGIELYSGGSQMNISLDQSNYISFLFNYIFSLLSNALGPLPIQIHGFSSLVLFFTEAIPMTVIVYLIYRNRQSIGYLDKMLLTQALIWFMFIGVTNDNLGTGSRLRVSGYLFILLVFVKIYYMNYIDAAKKKR